MAQKHKMFYHLEYVFVIENFCSYNYLEIKKKNIYIWCKTNNRKYFLAHFKYFNQLHDNESYFPSKQIEHSFHRKTYINSSRFCPLVIEVNQSEILKNLHFYNSTWCNHLKLPFAKLYFNFRVGKPIIFIKI